MLRSRRVSDLSRSLLVAPLCLLLSCGGGGGADGDGDGVSLDQGDCDDENPNVFPGATEVCNSLDDDCDGQVDQGFDEDADGVTACTGDCNDDDPAIFAGNSEIADGKDNDCDGEIDEGVDFGNDVDDDGDGFSEDGSVGGLSDCDDSEPLVGPSAIEVAGDAVDNDCNGQVDEPLVPCDDVALSNDDPFDYAKAIGFCRGEVLSAEFIGQSALGRAIVTSFGANGETLNVPAEGARMIELSSGAANTNQHDPGTAFDGTLSPGATTCQSFAHPDPQADPGACGAADPALVCDYTELKLTIQVPPNAQSFTYSFQFISAEYPTFRCTAFDDTFLAELESEAFTGNISFDANGNFVSINNGFFQVCFDDNGDADINDDGVVDADEQFFRPVAVPPNDCVADPGATLSGTGYLSPNNPGTSPVQNVPVQSSGAGATLPLVTSSPVVPGEIITLRFIIFDEGDDILDSTVLIDNFVWQGVPVEGPITEIP